MWAFPPALNSARIIDHHAPLFLIMSRRRLQVGIDDAAERHQIVGPPQAAATGDALEVVNAPQRCPANRYADERCGVRDVADKRNTPHGHQVVDLELVTAERVERMGDAEPSNIARRLITACIPGQSTRCRASISSGSSSSGGVRAAARPNW